MQKRKGVSGEEDVEMGGRPLGSVLLLLLLTSVVALCVCSILAALFPCVIRQTSSPCKAAAVDISCCSR